MRDQILQVMGNESEVSEEPIVENYVERVSGHLSKKETPVDEVIEESSDNSFAATLKEVFKGA